MEIKTTKDIKENMSKLHIRNGLSFDYEPHYNKKWVSVESILKELDNIEYHIKTNKCLICKLIDKLKGEQ